MIEAPRYTFATGDEIWTKLQEIAEHHGPRGSEESSSTSSSSAAESDSISSLRNSSPEGLGLKNSAGLYNKEDRLSPRCDFIYRPKTPVRQRLLASTVPDRLSPSVYSTKLTPAKADSGYHSLIKNKRTISTPTSSLEARSSPDLWDVRATKTPIKDLHILTHNAKRTYHNYHGKQHSVSSSVTSSSLLSSTSSSSSSSSSSSTSSSAISPLASNSLETTSHFDQLPDDVVVKILSYLTSNNLVQCSRVSRRFYFLAWDPSLWTGITLTGELTDADLGIKTIIRLLSRNSAKLSVSKIILNGCQRLTDRGLAIIARRCPQLRELEIQYCLNITNGGLMDLVSRCHLLDHLDVTGCQMISTISVHQPPPSPRTMMMMSSSSNIPRPLKRQLNLQYLDLSDCVSLEDTGLKMIVECCPQITYLFLRRCSNITDSGIKFVSSYCLSLRELSVSDCVKITDYGLYELAKLGPNLRYLSVAKCDRITDAGIKQVSRLCYKIRYLNVRGCEAVSDEALETVAQSCSRLRSLDIGKCDVTDVGLKMLAENCPNLKKLSVKSCEMVSDTGIRTVAYYCRGLQQLNIQDCPITIEGFRSVKKFCRRCIIEHSHPGFY